MKVAIIGSGFGGLSIALRLQSLGYEVTIFEKQNRIGGHAYQIKAHGYTFDLGPSLITAPSIIRRIFTQAGEDMDDHLELIPLDPFYRIYFHDKTYLDYSGNPEKMVREIAKFSPSDSEKYESFMKFAKDLYKSVILDGLGSKPFLSIKDFFLSAPKLISTLSILPAYLRVKQYFKDEKIRFTFSFHPLFIGGSPFLSPALYLMIPFLEREEGVWFTKGGMYSVVEKLGELFEKKGGKIKVGEEVEEIVIEDKTARSIRTNKGTYDFDIVISNAHIYHTNTELLASSKLKHWDKKKLNKAKYSMSTFLIYLGVKKKYDKLQHHTLILSERYKGLVDEIFSETTLPDDFSMYLHVPSKTDEGMAPAGCESMYVLIPVPNLNANIAWLQEKDRYTEKILDFLENEFGLDDLRSNIEYLSVFTPDDFQDQRNNHLGAAWSLQPTLFQSANFRPPNRSKDIRNLYYVGASTHPGGGVPGVMLSAEVTEKLIRQEYPL